MKSTDLGMGQWRLKAETDFDHRMIAEDALSQHDMDALFKVGDETSALRHSTHGPDILFLFC